MKIYIVEVQRLKTFNTAYDKYFSSMEKALEYAKRFGIEFDVQCLEEGKIYSLDSSSSDCINRGIIYRPRYIQVYEVDEN